MHYFSAGIEILIITIVINYLLSFFWNTRSMDLIWGVASFIILFALTSILSLPVLHRLMLLVTNVAVIAIIIIFQPEIRVALSKLSLKGKRYTEVSEFESFLDQLANSVYRLSDKQIGALIVLEKDNRLDDLARKATPLKAEFSSELLESIFSRYAPLHDGAVIIRDKEVVAASVILPLADAPHIHKSFGTRHRAAVGITLTTDAVAIVVSEETGRVSIARDGIITRGIKMDRFKGIIRSLFSTEAPVKKERRTFWEWLKT
ncbi:MAG: TIGR00159 family protein [Chlamydiae bacterium RIFCSPHIGHO2_12_FULL_49_11]|nr:MAG: TIGR00159 family protein [Chlamydiae bacterium RIFCSPHIGHO2_12_FULL_49_11]